MGKIIFKVTMNKLIQYLAKKFGYRISKIENKLTNNDFGLSNQTNREKWLECTLKNIPSGLRILDAGAGELNYKKFCTHLNYVSQDFAQYDGVGNNSGLQTSTWNNSLLDIVSDITSIPEPDASFDAIMCIEVFEHISSPVEAIKEFSRLLKKGGKLIITAPFASLTHFAPYHFYSGFNKYFYQKHLSDFGFEIEELSSNGNYFEFLAQEIRLRIPNQYSKCALTVDDKIVKDNFLLLLEILNNHSEKSEDLLCFGYHIIANKLK